MLLLLGSMVLAACNEGASTERPTTTEPSTYAANARLVRVVDGDTIEVSIDGRREKVRLIGIDTPETVKPNAPVECFGPEASAFTKGLLPEGTPLLLERDVEARDDYGRLLAYVHRAEDGLFVNLEIVAKGYGNLLTFPPNVAHVEDFRAAARAAEAADLGLWGGCSG
jgi:micrococcal nuclease